MFRNIEPDRFGFSCGRHSKYRSPSNTTESKGSKILSSDDTAENIQNHFIFKRIHVMFNSSLICLIAAAFIFSSSAFASSEIKTPINNTGIGVDIKIPSNSIPPLEETLTKCMGKVSQDALKNHPTFESYWNASKNSRAGFALEAVFSDTFNRRALATGNETRIYPSSSLGSKHAAADLIEVDKNGKIIAEYQCKTYKGDVYKALNDPKFKNMKLITTQETLEIMQKELAAAKESALRRGVPLSEQMKSLDEALNSGKLLQKSPCGAPLPNRSHLDKVARDTTKKLYDQSAAENTKPNSKRAPSKDVSVNESVKPSENPKSSPKPTSTQGEIIPDKSAASATPKGSAGKEAAEKIGAGAKALKVAAKTIPVIAVGVEGVNRGKEIMNTEEQFSNGKITVQEREIAHTKNVAGGVGGFTGAAYGFGIGAEGGAILGSFAGPVGTAVGGFAGGLAGGVAGYLGGEAAAKEGAGWAVEKVHSAGTTVAESAETAWTYTKSAAQSAASGVSSAWSWVWGK